MIQCKHINDDGGFMARKKVAANLTERAAKVDFDRKSLVGQLPDEDDKKNIQEFIKTYNEAYPPRHKDSLKNALKEGKYMTDPTKSEIKKGKLTKDSPVLALHLPLEFSIGIKRAYPLLFSDEVQFTWFLENFPEFDLSHS